ncbi:MAG: DUF86 domain-containing protein [Cyanobacteria bacterium J06626_14]
MSRDQQSILDIWNAAQEILSFTEGMDQASLTADRRTQAAVLYEIVIIGEATNRLSENYRAHHPTVPWKKIIGMRNILAHQYEKVDADVVWNVVHQDIPELMEMIAPFLPDEG